MSEKTCNCNCAEKRREQFKDLQPVLDQYAKVPGSLITILQKAQEIYGYLPIEVQKIIAEGLETPDELLKVLELDVDLLQGYFLAKPSDVPKPVSAESVAVIERFRKQQA